MRTSLSLLRPQLPVASPADRATPSVRRDAAVTRASSPFEGRRWAALCLVTDACLLWVAALVALETRPVPSGAALLLALAVAVAAGVLARKGAYARRPVRLSMLDAARDCAAAITAGAMAALAAAELVGVDGAAGVVVATWALGIVTVVAGRAVLTGVRRHARRNGAAGERVLIIGAGLVGAQLERRLLDQPELGLRPVGFLDAAPPPVDITGGRSGEVLGAPEDLERIVGETAADHVVIGFTAAPDSTVQPLLRACDELGLDVSVVPRLFEEHNARQRIEHVGGLPVVGLRRTRPTGAAFLVKHAFDRVVAGFLVIVCAPVLLACAAAVRISSPGPVLFRQRRVGRDGQSFDILKFRSMRLTRADDPGFTPAAGAAPGGIEGDDRRTRVGTFLRRTSLDELPQLLNVVRGEMSLVGPRPERPEFVELFGRDVRRYGDRHRVRSGMTGWAQVHGLRGQTSLAERVEWDNWYIANWSLWLDLKILLLTPLAVLKAPAEGPPPSAQPAADRAETTPARPATAATAEPGSRTRELEPVAA